MVCGRSSNNIRADYDREQNLTYSDAIQSSQPNTDDFRRVSCR